ncbi:plant seed peroxygenase [Synchytrium endobioticum]|uniref:Plant seed peroxygenase n=1 Tax=Synchytrium endobioticum TaxID=286115 RepID=A0A507D6R8_9FUNG|nr:plant seed peroxygenase [Synchytrium endobioticum]
MMLQHSRRENPRKIDLQVRRHKYQYSKQMAKVTTMVDGAPVTKDYPIAPPEAVEKIPHPEIPRANLAVSAEFPEGSQQARFKHLSVMQQHVTFFDFDDDGRIFPWDTYKGFRLMGFNFVYSFLAMLFINLNLSYSTQESWIPDFRFPVIIKNIHKDKHGSDSDIYDTEGRFRPQQFEELFSRFAKKDSSKLYLNELLHFLRRHQRPMDFFGRVATFLEWITLWLLCGEGHGWTSYITKENVRRQYDGTLFYEMAEKEAAIRRKKGKGQKNEALKSAIYQSAEAVQDRVKKGISSAQQNVTDATHSISEKWEQLREKAVHKEE